MQFLCSPPLQLSATSSLTRRRGFDGAPRLAFTQYPASPRPHAANDEAALALNYLSTSKTPTTSTTPAWPNWTSSPRLPHQRPSRTSARVSSTRSTSARWPMLEARVIDFWSLSLPAYSCRHRHVASRPRLRSHDDDATTPGLWVHRGPSDGRHVRRR